MRIRLLTSHLSTEDLAQGSLADMLAKKIPMLTGNTVTEESPDIVHIFGCWDYQILKATKELYHRRIPYIYSPLEGLMPWNMKSWKSHPNFCAQQREAVKRAVSIQVCGQMEKEVMEQLGWNNRIIVIPNPVTTSLMTEVESLRLFMDFYQDAVLHYDQTIHDDIQRQLNAFPELEESARELLKKILYAHYLYQRRQIPKSFLDELAHCMIQSDYNEDQMAEVLSKLHLLQFVARLETVLSWESDLTEGFMPIIQKNDRETDRIKNCITNYH